MRGAGARAEACEGGAGSTSGDAGPAEAATTSAGVKADAEAGAIGISTLRDGPRTEAIGSASRTPNTEAITACRSAARRLHISRHAMSAADTISVALTSSRPA